MDEFQLSFTNGEVRGRGIDIIGPFTFRGEYDTAGGSIGLVKQYVGKHAVIYRGEPDGEGSIFGTWSVENDVFGITFKGPFLMQPAREKRTNELPIRGIYRS